MFIEIKCDADVSIATFLFYMKLKCIDIKNIITYYLLDIFYW